VSPTTTFDVKSGSGVTFKYAPVAVVAVKKKDDHCVTFVREKSSWSLFEHNPTDYLTWKQASLPEKVTARIVLVHLVPMQAPDPMSAYADVKMEPAKADQGPVPSTQGDGTSPEFLNLLAQATADFVLPLPRAEDKVSVGLNANVPRFRSFKVELPLSEAGGLATSAHGAWKAAPLDAVQVAFPSCKMLRLNKRKGVLVLSFASASDATAARVQSTRALRQGANSKDVRGLLSISKPLRYQDSRLTAQGGYLYGERPDKMTVKRVSAASLDQAIQKVREAFATTLAGKDAQGISFDRRLDLYSEPTLPGNGAVESKTKGKFNVYVFVYGLAEAELLATALDGGQQGWEVTREGGSNKVCFGCNKHGHLKRDCPAPQEAVLRIDSHQILFDPLILRLQEETGATKAYSGGYQGSVEKRFGHLHYASDKDMASAMVHIGVLYHIKATAAPNPATAQTITRSLPSSLGKLDCCHGCGHVNEDHRRQRLDSAHSSGDPKCPLSRRFLKDISKNLDFGPSWVFIPTSPGKTPTDGFYTETDTLSAAFLGDLFKDLNMGGAKGQPARPRPEPPALSGRKAGEPRVSAAHTKPTVPITAPSPSPASAFGIAGVPYPTYPGPSSTAQRRLSFEDRPPGSEERKERSNSFSATDNAASNSMC
jgi:hypothetical protein